MKISIIIVSFNTRNLLGICLETLFKHPGPHPLEVFVVDNHSADGSAEMVRQDFSQVQCIENNMNLGFAAANNQAYQKSTGDFVILLNPDAYVKKQTIRNAITFMMNHPDCGLAGGRLVNPEGVLDPSARRFPNSLYKLFTLSGLSDKYPTSKILGKGDFKYFDHGSIMEVDWVPGTFTIYRRDMLDQTGLFDERFFVYYEETDLCRKARQLGWKIFFIPDAEVVHVGGASAKTRKDLKFDKGGSQVLKFRMRSEYLYFRKNHGLFSVLANAGVELGWHLLRYLMNHGAPNEIKQYKKMESASILQHGTQALRDTAFGRKAPPRPW
ncbi:glycosyltransferase family 2 protein [Desulfobacterales bacterium HSG17]|nr:glycosyltransferase family 2 protein [Desulfobacterales bacterium HSG17]